MMASVGRDIAPGEDIVGGQLGTPARFVVMVLRGKVFYCNYLIRNES